MSRKTIKADKLVRDKIPGIIEKDGGKPVYFSIFGYPYQIALYDKMEEEFNEFKQAVIHEDSADILEELGDMYEVFVNIAKAHGYSMQDIIDAADVKREEKGGFESHFFLKRYIKNDNNSSDSGIKEINEVFESEKEQKEYKSERLLF